MGREEKRGREREKEGEGRREGEGEEERERGREAGCMEVHGHAHHMNSFVHKRLCESRAHQVSNGVVMTDML